MIYTFSMGRASRSWEMSAYVLCIVGNAKERGNTSHGERCQWKETQDESLVVIRGRRKITLQVPERVSWAEEYTKQVKLKKNSTSGRNVRYKQDDRLGYASDESL
jgi:hypothetical protein